MANHENQKESAVEVCLAAKHWLPDLVLAWSLVQLPIS